MEGQSWLSQQSDIKHAWCVLLFNWPWNINRASIHWLTFDWRGRERERRKKWKSGCTWMQGELWCRQCVTELLLCQLTCQSIVFFVTVASCRHTGCRGWLADANETVPVVIYASADDSFLLCTHAADNMGQGCLTLSLLIVGEKVTFSVFCHHITQISHCMCVGLERVC